MTEQEWLECTDRHRMQDFLRAKASKRKSRLFACACCRRIWNLLTDNRSREAVEISERYADGFATQEELDAAEIAARDALEDAWPNAKAEDLRCGRPRRRKWEVVNPEQAAWFAIRNFAREAAESAATALACAVYDSFRANRGVYRAKTRSLVFDARSLEELAQINLVREVTGNPFCPVTVDPSWLTLNTTALAQAIYAECRFDDMPVLADALEEAGCTTEDILSHCRSGGEHVRGCWVVDLILEKE